MHMTGTTGLLRNAPVRSRIHRNIKKDMAPC